jgi:hypothetical protein
MLLTFLKFFSSLETMLPGRSLAPDFLWVIKVTHPSTSSISDAQRQAETAVVALPGRFAPGFVVIRHIVDAEPVIDL